MRGMGGGAPLMNAPGRQSARGGARGRRPRQRGGCGGAGAPPPKINVTTVTVTVTVTTTGGLNLFFKNTIDTVLLINN